MRLNIISKIGHKADKLNVFAYHFVAFGWSFVN